MITALIAAVLIFAVGTLILRANPRRRVNFLVATCSYHASVWLLLFFLTTSASEFEGLYWLRWTTAVGALLPLHLLLVKEELSGESRQGRRLRRLLPWIAVTLFVAGVPFSEWFIPAHSTPSQRVYGTGYYVYIFGVVSMYVALFINTWRRLGRVSGVERLELQVWLFGGSITAVGILLSMAASAILHEPSLVKFHPLIVLLFFAVTAVAITSARVFDARHLFLIGLVRLLLVVLVAGVGFGVDVLFVLFVPSAVAWIATAAVALWFAAECEKLINNVLLVYPEAANARAKAYEVATREVRSEVLEDAFVRILKGWSQSEAAFLAIRSDDGIRVGQSFPAVEEAIFKTMAELRWATPERLQRERGSADRRSLEEFIRSRRLGLLVLREGLSVDVLVGIGVRATHRPFTYPEVQQVQEMASIIQTALARGFIWRKAQRAEQLATVGLLGASVAHEIRNPLVSIKTFVQLFPTHYQDENFRNRFSGLIASEVARIERLTEQLLDLASPRKYILKPTSLHEVIRASRDLIISKAEDKRVELLSELLASPDVVLIDGNAAKQVILNLCFNSVQAQENQERPRWIRITTRNVPRGVELTVADNGPGISAEIRPRLFEAFQTTKSSGFGLGLAICSDILSSLGSSIRVDPFVSGQGATFRVVFPCPPPSS